jgi:hypothetical protein
MTSADYLKNKLHWEQVFYEFIFEALGFSKNKEQMMKLARSLKLKLLRAQLKNTNSKEKVMISLLFGVSGCYLI